MPRDVEIRKIDLANPSDRAAFVDVADRIYAKDPNGIVPLRLERMAFLDTSSNPALASLEIAAFLAVRKGKVVGRITSHIDRAYNELHGTNVAWFGFFESVDDEAIAHALFTRAVLHAKHAGASTIFGPSNFTTNHQIGLLVENFDRPAFVEMTYNPRYYERLFTDFGFSKATDLLTWWIDVRPGIEDPHIARFHRIAEKVRARAKFTVRHARIADIEREVEILFGLYNDCWVKNWGFVPVSHAEFKKIANDLKHILIEELVLLVEHEGRAVGFSVTLPNVNERMPKDGRIFPFGWWKLLSLKNARTARLMVLGVHPDYQKRGVEGLLCVETAMRARELGFVGGEIGWTLESNVMVNRAAEAMGAKLDRRYRVYGMTL